MATSRDKPHKSERLVAVAQIQETGEIRGRSLTSDALRRLCRNRAAMIGAVSIIISVFVALLAPSVAPKAFDDALLPDSNSAPLWLTKVFPSMKPIGVEGGYIKVNDSYLLGADGLGRDLLSRIIYGTRISLSIAIVAPLISIILGLLVGLIAGYKGGRVDNVLMRFVDIMYAFPTYLLIILLMAVFRLGSGQVEPGSLTYALGKLDAQWAGCSLFSSALVSPPG